jgi:5'-phosphate synthase pdxT subunit
VKIGVLALQGDFREHVAALTSSGAQAVEVRLASHLDGLGGLIIPGGESTTIGKLLTEFELMQPLRDRIRTGFPVYGTCAGMIVMAKDIGDFDQPILGVMDMRVERNAFGRQVDSFEVDLPILGIEGGPVHAVFIRAPLIRSVEPNVRVIGRLDDGTIVAARQGNMLATAFHPELTGDSRVHRLFIDMVRETADRGTELIRNAV